MNVKLNPKARPSPIDGDPPQPNIVRLGSCWVASRNSTRACRSILLLPTRLVTPAVVTGTVVRVFVLGNMTMSGLPVVSVNGVTSPNIPRLGSPRGRAIDR